MLSFSFSWPRFLSRWGQKSVMHIPSVVPHDLENSPEKPTRALKHLLKLNHANHAILYNERQFHNHAPHVGFFIIGWLKARHANL